MFDWFSSDENNWKEVGTILVNQPMALKLRENTVCVETEDGKCIDIEGDSELFLHRERKVHIEKNQETGEIRGYFLLWESTREYLPDEHIEALIDQMKQGNKTS